MHAARIPLLALALFFGTLAPLGRGQVVLPPSPAGGANPQQGGTPERESKQKQDPRVLPDTPRGFNAERAERELELPDARPVLAPRTPPAVAPVEPATLAPAVPVAGEANAASYVLAEVAKLRDVGSPMLEQATTSLVRMGEVGRAAALGALGSDHAPTFLVGLRALLASGEPLDAERALARLDERLPTAAASAAVEALCELAPARANVETLSRLLGHRQTPVRVAAQRRLAALGEALPASALATPLGHKDADTRLRATSLLESSRDPLATTLLLERLGDANGAVARRAVDALAPRAADGLDAELVVRAFAERGLLRRGAYALLALCEREDLRLEPVLGATHVPRLVEGLGSRDSLVAAASAAALAGIGFRSPEGLDTTWLDLGVPHRLVRAISAEDFSPDFSSIVPTAVRRLHLITGQNFGADGPRWVQWWSAHASGFRAARAAMAVRAEDAGALEVRLEDELVVGRTSVLRLVGAQRARELDARGQLDERTLVLAPSQARALWDVLAQGGIFGGERLPGGRGSSFEPGRTLTVECHERAKSFRFAGAASEAWFGRAVDEVRALEERNRWQLFPEPGVALGRVALWEAEAPWWEGANEPAARAAALWRRVMLRASKLPPAERDSAVTELARIQSQSACATADDLGALIALLRDERFFGARARTLLELAMAAAQGSASELPSDAASELVDVWIAGLESNAPEELAGVFSRAGVEFTLARARDERPFVRAVAATALVRTGGERELTALRSLLDDSELRVVAAALLSLGEARVVAATGEVLARTRHANVDVRVAALRSLGHLGGDAALGTLLASLSDSDPAVRIAAAEGMTALRDPGSVPLLVSLLAKGPKDVTYAPARRGLLAQGSKAWDELLRMARAPSSKARREAALLLSEQLVPQAMSPLLTLLAEEPGDARVAEELAVLSCLDLRSKSNASAAWWAWWEDVAHDDPQAWLAAAAGRIGLAPCESSAIRAGTGEGLAFLEQCARRDENWLCERARREFARLVGRDVGALPSRGRQRDLWLSTLREQLAARAKG
ncbi:MAG: hypothetical protein FJ294_00820 [Planctomycetes bacterium]|nr:hypothetical protein [Planctomycetota bacterium]